MDEKQSSLSDEVIIEIVHSIKDIVIELIDRAFPKKENKFTKLLDYIKRLIWRKTAENKQNS